MGPAQRSQVEVQTQKAKLASSYNALLEEFTSKDLRTVGNYSVGKLIGKGSFGKVYLASHKLINGSKVVLKSASKDDSNLTREIHHHRQFLHPHIARLYEVIVTETSVWLVLEYCPGDELYYYLTQHGAIEPTKVQRIFTQLVGAVSYVHGKSCVHRDLKLENILLDKNEDVKLCDFGFTREYEGKSSYLQTWCGTVCYSAPEMLKGEKYAGERVDVWSLGIILYALLCGELPFDEEDEDKTKAKILKEEPKYPDSMPNPARELINLMLSKRPLLRPSLADILTNPWLAEYSPLQQAILKVQQPAPFSTQLETDTLQRMRSAGVNIDAVIENVLSQRCDGLAGWWALLLEKEERKEQRRLLKRKERDAETKASRRISTASGRFLANTIQEERSTEWLNETIGGERGRSPGRSPIQMNGRIVVTPPQVSPSEPLPSPGFRLGPSSATKPLEHRVHRPVSGSRTRRRSGLGPPINNKRNSMLHVMTAAEATTVSNDAGLQKRKRKYQPLFLAQLSNIKSWFKDSSKRGKQFGGSNVATDSQNQEPAPNKLHRVTSDVLNNRSSGIGARPELHSHNTFPQRPRLATHSSFGSNRRLSSHSPSPLTPKSSYRRSTGGGMRGRKSTSSSVSSIRSFHAQHHPTHSKASSVSSDMGSPSALSISSVNVLHRRSSPNTSIKVLPAQKRAPPKILLPETQNGNAFTGLGPPSPGIMFAKRKRTPFQGPKLGPGTRRRSDGTVVGAEGPSLATANVPGRKSNELAIHQEEDEEDYEEVEAFTPVELGESVEFVHDTSVDLTKWELEN